jgi:integrase
MEITGKDLTKKSFRSRVLKPDSRTFVPIRHGLSLGYYKGRKAVGTWKGRLFNEGTSYDFESLGLADDVEKADGSWILTFDQASDKALAWARKREAEKAGGVVPGAYSVQKALNDWLADREKAKRKTLNRTRYTIAAAITPVLGSIELEKLTHRHVKQWWDGLECLKAKPGVPDTSEAMRKRQSTANRILTVLRAALNFAYYETHRVTSRNAWDKLRPYKNVDSATIKYLNLEDLKKLIAACSEDFRLVFRAGIYTGLRYSEICNLTVGDFNGTALLIQRTKGGKPRWAQLTPEGIEFFRSVSAGRGSVEIMFTHTSGRHKGEAWAHSQQRHWMLQACQAAEIAPIGFHCATRHSFASLLVKNKTPMPVIAALLGHANGDTRMVTKHYAHLSDDYVGEQLNANLPSFL